MGQSSNELCGHDRETLKWVLAQEDGRIRHLATDPYTHKSLLAESAAARDVSDPAKLAELLASEGRRLGFGIEAEARENGVTIRIKDNLPLPLLLFRTIASARAILRAWLELQDGEAEKALKALRGGT